MLVELIVENFRSIKKQQTFSLAKSKSAELDDHSFKPDAPGSLPLLSCAALYGANAAGKSNFIRALRAMQEIVSDSAKEFQRGDHLPVTPFRLDEITANQPTVFELVFIAQNVKYQYGFALNSERITEEWLYAFPKGRPQRWFIRAWDKKENDYAWDFSSFFLGKKQLWREATRSNSLFLSTAVMLNNEQLKPVYDWFIETLKVTNINGWDPAYTAKLCTDANDKAEVLNFLKSADLDISDLKLEFKTIDSSFLPDDMPNAVKDSLLRDLKGKEFIDIKTVHKTSSGHDVYFDMDDESDGTRKIFAFAGPWIDTLKHGNVLFIDELHDSLHPHIVKFLVNLFHNKKTNPNNAQLVFTTHETSILDQQVFRRDQIWFCNKEKDQSTTIYPLTDFSPRKGLENLEKSYLNGRYGALPLITSLEYAGE